MNWREFRGRLAAADPSANPGGAGPEGRAEDVDDVVDDMLEHVRRGGGTGANAQALPHALAALAAARSTGTRRDAAWLVARCAGAEGVAARGAADAVDALAAQYRGTRTHAVLGPDFLSALAALAERTDLAQAAVADALLRLDEQDSGFLRVRAAKLAGRLQALGRLGSDVARRILEPWTAAVDLPVQAEARFQLAVMDLAAALREDAPPPLHAALGRARLGFVNADLSEEERVDARYLLALVDLVLAYLQYQDPGATRDDAAIGLTTGVLRNRAAALRRLVADPVARSWAGYASGAERITEHRLYRVAVGFERLADALGTADEWTNFDAALVEVAGAFMAMTESDPMGRPDDSNVQRAPLAVLVRGFAASYHAPLGPLLDRVVRRTRLAKVVERYEAGEAKGGAANGGAIAATLRRLHAAACALEYEAGADPHTAPNLDAGAYARLTARAPALAAQVAPVLPEFGAARPNAGPLPDSPGGGPGFTVPPASLAVDAPHAYGNDPDVDDTVRRVLPGIAARAGGRLSDAAWRGVESAVVSLVRLARDVRNDLPAFARCADDGGLGQQADEGDLQRYLFEHLRREYGRAAVYEAGPNSGGRPDSGLRLEGVEIPIEVKADYHRVDEDHVRANYLGQADQYATNRDGVAVLMILDLRATHAARHRKARTAGDAGTVPIKLYSLRESFRVDGLLADSQIVGALTNAVVVGLVPGNQVRPSSMTTYSRRPRRRD